MPNVYIRMGFPIPVKGFDMEGYLLDFFDRK
jgi:hypothetical protein